ncbi:MAG: 50S ribosomal protein L19 [Clostridia bacterium]|nr:50S ribosomal protein L19 [Clostridia bacterium]
MNSLMNIIEKDSIVENRPEFHVGDTVDLKIRIKEGNKTRLQSFEGTVIAMKGSGVSETFTVRKISSGVGVERVFPVNCPNIEEIIIKSKGKVRRAKLYYLRNKIGKAAKIKTKV